MRLPTRRLSLALSLCIVLSAVFPAAGSAQQPPRSALGAGAQFLPADTFLYTAIDPNAHSRLLDVFKEAVSSEIGTSDLFSWMGREAFFAFPRLDDLTASVGSLSGEIDVDCQDP